MSARVFYTRDEDTLLVKYIAKYNPTGKGRAGNTLYRKLCDDADNKWKWSRNHSWQSWRDRYYKNQEQFDEKIKAYQKKHGISAADPDELEKARDDAGSAEDDDKDTGEDEAESSAAPGKRKRAYEDEKKRARMKYDSKPSQERRVSQGKRPEVFVKGKGTKLADMHDEKDKDIRSKSESGRNPSDVDQGRVLKTHAGDVQGKEKVKPSTTGEPRNVNERYLPPIREQVHLLHLSSPLFLGSTMTNLCPRLRRYVNDDTKNPSQKLPAPRSNSPLHTESQANRPSPFLDKSV
ncbi:hypothetical protein FPV67DRAFT_1144408 [Lyophyllum atratum]|nr:hypothetical protein FPV67DRAFT_1144408 [Lyophyllum atratum]